MGAERREQLRFESGEHELKEQEEEVERFFRLNGFFGLGEPARFVCAVGFATAAYPLHQPAERADSLFFHTLVQASFRHFARTPKESMLELERRGRLFELGTDWDDEAQHGDV